MSENNEAKNRQLRLALMIRRALDEILVGPLGPFIKRKWKLHRDGSVTITLWLVMGGHNFIARDRVWASADYNHAYARCEMLTMAFSELQFNTSESLRAKSA